MAAASRTGAAQTGKNSAGPGRFPVAEPGFVELFTPKSIAVLREGYGFADPRSDIVAGMTVAIVALPLSMAIAIASGVTPERGLYTAIVGGGLVSAPGGSRFQIGGPAGAFIVLVAATVEAHGPDGLLLATMLSGPARAGRTTRRWQPAPTSRSAAFPARSSSGRRRAPGWHWIISATARARS